MMQKAQNLKNSPIIDKARTLNREAGRNTNMFFGISVGLYVSNDFSLNESGFIEVSSFEISSIELFGKKSSNMSVERLTRYFALDLKFSWSGDFEYCQARVQVPNPLSQQAPKPDSKVRPSLKNPKTQIFGLG